MDVFLVEAGHPGYTLVPASTTDTPMIFVTGFVTRSLLGGDLRVIARSRIKAHPGFCVYTAGSDADSAGQPKKNKSSGQVRRSEYPWTSTDPALLQHCNVVVHRIAPLWTCRAAVATPGVSQVISGPDIPMTLRFNTRVDARRSELILVAPGGHSQSLHIVEDSPPDRLVSEARG